MEFYLRTKCFVSVSVVFVENGGQEFVTAVGELNVGSWRTGGHPQSGKDLDASVVQCNEKSHFYMLFQLGTL